MRCWLIIGLLVIAGSAHAQGAWVGDAKSLTVDLGYAYEPYDQVIDSAGAVGSSPDITTGPDPTTKNHVVTLGVEYVPIENLAIEASLPFASTEWAASDQNRKHFPPGEWDDGKFHNSFTDFRIGVRYQILDAPILAVSPYAAFSTPVEKYQVVGFATDGRHLTSGHLGVSIGRTLDPFLPNLYFMGTFEFTFAQGFNPGDTVPNIPEQEPQLENYGQSRTDVDAQIGYLFLDGDLNINIATVWRHQLDGISFINGKGTGNDAAAFVYHDGILRESYNTLGGGASYAINRKLTVSLAYQHFITGYNTRNQDYYGLNFAYRVL